MPSITFWVFIAAGAYMLIFEALLRVRRNTKRGKHTEDTFGVKQTRIIYLVIGLIFIGLAFLWYS